jgi:hypothetical protein
MAQSFSSGIFKCFVYPALFYCVFYFFKVPFCLSRYWLGDPVAAPPLRPVTLHEVKVRRQRVERRVDVVKQLRGKAG